MTPNRIILVRHGRSAANDDPTVYSRVPDYKIELADKGYEQARTAGDHIREIIGGESYGGFISCRREGGTAQLLYDRLTQMRYRMSFGLETLRGGKFNAQCQ